jgi:uncharacterized protein
MRRIRIRAGKVQVEATLNDTQKADKVWAALPIQARASTWGDEIYFSIPVSLEEENAKETVALGDLGYWPPGNALCIFFGPTPMSRGNEIRPASPVNVFGQVEGDTAALRTVGDGERVTVEGIGRS